MYALGFGSRSRREMNELTSTVQPGGNLLIYVLNTCQARLAVVLSHSEQEQWYR
jgi:hypothetical protein